MWGNFSSLARISEPASLASLASLDRADKNMRGVRSQLGLRVSATAKHLFDFRDVHLLVANFLTRKFLERNTTILAESQQAPIKVDAFALVYQQLLHDVVNRFVISPREFPDAE